MSDTTRKAVIDRLRFNIDIVDFTAEFRQPGVTSATLRQHLGTATIAGETCELFRSINAPFGSLEVEAAGRTYEINLAPICNSALARIERAVKRRLKGTREDFCQACGIDLRSKHQERKDSLCSQCAPKIDEATAS